MLTAKQISTRKNAAYRYGHVNAYQDFKVRSEIDSLGYILEAIDFIQNHLPGAELFFPVTAKVSDTLQIGGMPISPADALFYHAQPAAGAPSFKINEYLKGGSTLPISLRFASRAWLVGDFKTDELKPVLSYSCAGYHFATNGLQSTTISGLKIVGNKGFNNVPGAGTNQVGLLMTGGNSINFDNCIFLGLEEGFIHNCNYHNRMETMKFKNCNRGFFTTGSHSTSGDNLLADHCNTGYEIVSGANSWKQMSTEQCSQGIIVGGSNNVFEGGYLEQLDDMRSEPGWQNKYQIQVGYAKDHPLYTPDVVAVGFNGQVVTNRSGNNVLFEEGALQVSTHNMKASGKNLVKNRRILLDNDCLTLEYSN